MAKKRYLELILWPFLNNYFNDIKNEKILKILAKENCQLVRFRTIVLGCPSVEKFFFVVKVKFKKITFFYFL